MKIAETVISENADFDLTEISQWFERDYLTLN